MNEQEYQEKLELQKQGLLNYIEAKEMEREFFYRLKQKYYNFKIAKIISKLLKF